MWASGALRPCVGTFEKSWTGPAWPAEAVGQELATTEVKCGPVQNWIGGVRNLLAGSVQSPIGAGLRRQELLRGRRDTPAKSSAAATCHTVNSIWQGNCEEVGGCREGASGLRHVW